MSRLRLILKSTTSHDNYKPAYPVDWDSGFENHHIEPGETPRLVGSGNAKEWHIGVIHNKTGQRRTYNYHDGSFYPPVDTTKQRTLKDRIALREKARDRGHSSLVDRKPIRKSYGDADVQSKLMNLHDRHAKDVSPANLTAWHHEASALARNAGAAHDKMHHAESTFGKFSPEHLQAKSDKAQAMSDHASHMLGIPKSSNENPPDPYGSIKKHSVNGDYTPKRKQVHEEIINHFMDAYKSHPLGQFNQEELDQHPQAVFMMGGTGSGKGYQKKKRYGHHPGFVNIDPDEIKEHLATADGMKGAHNYLPGHWHEESSDIAKKMQDKAHAERRSYIYDTVGGNAESLIKKAKKAEPTHQLHLRQVKTDREQAWKQNLARARMVPRKVFDAAHDGVESAFEPAKRYFQSTRRGTAKQWYNMRQMNKSITAGVWYNNNGGDDVMSDEMNKSTKGGCKAKAHLGGDAYLLGIVKNDHFHAYDSVHNGVSQHALTGQAPKYKPVPLSKMVGHYKARIEYLK